ncbi:hypothetical protein J1614_011348 [Plenodomus biglobosus]|nr:hypothetical protein J1614_011348 [Plenodomus biglobosus]
MHSGKPTNRRGGGEVNHPEPPTFPLWIRQRSPSFFLQLTASLDSLAVRVQHHLTIAAIPCRGGAQPLCSRSPLPFIPPHLFLASRHFALISAFALVADGAEISACQIPQQLNKTSLLPHSLHGYRSFDASTIMNRKDSGFVEFHASKPCHQDSSTLQRSNTAPTTAPTPRRKHCSSSTNSPPPSKPTDMDPEYPASERQSRPVRQTSTTSSGESTTKSKSRGYSSKPSSRRTSFTIVDPSRPARHYRIKSSQSVPAATGQDIDDVLALHFRSCSLFTNPSYQSASRLPSPTLSPRAGSTYPTGPSRYSIDDMRANQAPVLPEDGEDSIAVVDKTNTTMHWTSPCSRKREYERIDRANSGIRGLFRKALPRSISGPQEKFYEKDQSDAGSVRRYRLCDVDDDNNTNPIEKLPTQHQARGLERPVSSQRKSSWGCF